MSRSIMAAAAVAMAALMPQTPAVAQESGIVVAAPRVMPSWEPKNTVHRDTVIRAHVFVPTADLDLRSVYGRYVLARRMRLAAYHACGLLRGQGVGGVGSMMNPDPQDCRHNAYKYAQRDARYLIFAAG
jgi:UrcA family protein